ncbi:DUF3558 family protein [Corynebacterium sp. zg-913]|uniref:DUF3558 family protein n=1 Tax=Corynebacterium wankanglinii TaxID=2735136 RepID=A0A7H0KBR3_9CORY|nr:MULTISPECIES: DUF3558 family protein [Corynebacterium]MBA1837480.1 DUF3558 family protein [Corynebacterium wankanglinii]QNP94729.1 DUF3558 family protein [Corynebacterium wankanglinii]
MKRHVAWLLSCGLLVGCASTPPPIDEPSAHPHTTTPTAQPGSAAAAAADSTSAGGASTSSTTPAAFHFKSGTLEIGDFDPYALGDNLFDPCTEISPEEFAAAGFENVEPIPEEYAGLARGIKVCDVSKHDDVPSEGFSNNNANQKIIESQTSLITNFRSERVPEIFVFGPKSGHSSSCYAQLDTPRGGIVSQVAGWDGVHSQERTCEIAVRNLEELLLTHSR